VTRLHHYDDLGTARFVTFSCFMRAPSLTLSNAMVILARELDRARQTHGFLLLGYVFMPDHVHLVLLPPEGMKLGQVVGEIKSRSARAYFATVPIGPPDAAHVFWQRRCYDHNCRTLETVCEKIRYCHNNPVRRGLVADASDWVWSSYNAYLGKADVPLVVEAIPL